MLKAQIIIKTVFLPRVKQVMYPFTLLIDFFHMALPTCLTFLPPM